MTNVKIVLRGELSSDISFIYSTMLKNLYYSNDYYGSIAKAAFFSNYGKVLDHLRQKSKVIVACDAADPDVVLGYAIVQPGVFHFAYVKEAFRKQGVLRAMVADMVFDNCTHLTKVGDAIRRKKKIAFNPFLI